MKVDFIPNENYYKKKKCCDPPLIVEERNFELKCEEKVEYRPCDIDFNEVYLFQYRKKPNNNKK